MRNKQTQWALHLRSTTPNRSANECSKRGAIKRWLPLRSALMRNPMKKRSLSGPHYLQPSSLVASREEAMLTARVPLTVLFQSSPRKVVWQPGPSRVERSRFKSRTICILELGSAPIRRKLHNNKLITLATRITRATSSYLWRTSSRQRSPPLATICIKPPSKTWPESKTQNWNRSTSCKRTLTARSLTWLMQAVCTTTLSLKSLRPAQRWSYS